MAEILTIIGLVIIVLGFLFSAVWWMSTLFSMVKNNGKSSKAMSSAIIEIRDLGLEHAKECDSDRAVLANTLQLTESNMTIMNGQLTEHARRITETSQKLNDHIDQQE